MIIIFNWQLSLYAMRTDMFRLYYKQAPYSTQLKENIRHVHIRNTRPIALTKNKHILNN